jgi:MTH538 TIR-like domain (DUF1863)
MLFLIPVVAAAAGVLLLQRKKSVDTDLVQEEIKLDYRRIYICHSFRDSKSYKRIVSKLKLSENCKVWNHSIPQHKQKVVENDDELREAFKAQMRGCTHVFVLATSDLPRKSYVKMEIEVAQALGKRIIAIRPRGSTYVPKFIKDAKPEYISNDIRTVQKTLKR